MTPKGIQNLKEARKDMPKIRAAATAKRKTTQPSLKIETTIRGDIGWALKRFFKWMGVGEHECGQPIVDFTHWNICAWCKCRSRCPKCNRCIFAIFVGTVIHRENVHITMRPSAVDTFDEAWAKHQNNHPESTIIREEAFTAMHPSYHRYWKRIEVLNADVE